MSKKKTKKIYKTIFENRIFMHVNTIYYSPELMRNSER